MLAIKYEMLSCVVSLYEAQYHTVGSTSVQGIYKPWFIYALIKFLETVFYYENLSTLNYFFIFFNILKSDCHAIIISAYTVKPVNCYLQLNLIS